MSDDTKLSLIIVDEKGLIVEAGRKICNLLGLFCDELVGIKASTVIKDFRIDDFPVDLALSETESVKKRQEIELHGTNGSTITVTGSWNWCGRDGFRVLTFVLEIPRQLQSAKLPTMPVPSVTARLLDDAGAGIGFYDLESRIVYFNQVALTLMASDAGSLLGKTAIEVYGEELGGVVRDRINFVAKTRSRQVYEDLVDIPAGNMWFLSTYAPIADVRGNLMGVQIVSHDITSRKQLERRSEASRALVQSIIDSHDYPIFSIDRNYRYTSFNQSHAAAMKQMYNADIEIGRSLFEFISVEEDAEKAKYNLNRALAGERFIAESHTGDTLLSRRYYEISHSPVVDSAGNVIGASFLAEDQTEARLKQDQLRKSEVKYRRLYESLMDAFVQTDMVGNIVASNQAMRDLVGYSDEELKTKTYLDLTPRRWHAMEAQIVTEQILVRGFSDVYEKEYIRKDGSVIAIELRTSLLVDGQGVAEGMWAIVRDITPRKRLEDSIIRKGRELRLIIDSIPARIAYLDSKGTYLNANQSFVQHLGLTLDEIVGHNKDEFPNFVWAVIGSKRVDQVLNGNAVSIDTEVSDQQNTQSWRNINLIPYRNLKGVIDSYFLFDFNVTELRTKQLELEAVNKSLGEHSAALEQKNTALRQVLQTIEEERAEYQRSVNELIRSKIEPLRNYCHKNDNQLPKQLLATLDDVVHKLSHGLLGSSFSAARMRLTTREIEVCEMIRKGMSSKQIADELNLSVQTVNKHRQRIRHKLELNNTDLSLAGYLWNDS